MVPTDVPVWAAGEPANRACTKTGGLPYGPASLPWPAGRDNLPASFVGQICFADSRDTLQRGMYRDGGPLTLPGDVLLLFSPGGDGLWDSDEDDPKSLIYEWHSLGLADLVQSSAVPEQPFKVGIAHAQLHRTFDLPAVPDDHPLVEKRADEPVFVLTGGKMGGVPSFQESEYWPKGATFLATLGSIHATDKRHPLIGVPTNPDHFGLEGDYLMFGDVGSLHLFISERGLLSKKQRLHWTVQMG
jgi:uncharacterized protein YwqG